jgi:hypothetical protein
MTTALVPRAIEVRMGRRPIEGKCKLMLVRPTVRGLGRGNPLALERAAS